MDHQQDPGNVFTAMHHRVTGELLHLMDGLYSNIEDGLFELAFHSRQESQKRRCFDLMREMRFQRSRVVQNFARRLQGAFDGWISASPGTLVHPPGEQSRRMAHKCYAHFSGVLQSLAERSSFALEREVEVTEMPIGPHQISGHFIESMKALDFDDESIEIVEELFSRFVLERLGSVYGECNQRLEQVGFYTETELAQVSTLSAS